MTNYYRCYDSPRQQVVTIEWERVIERSDSQDRPDENDDGFWPSLDRNAGGWIGDNPKRSYEEQMESAQVRMTAWEEGDWYYVGVVARAHISVPIGQGSFATFTVDSAGLWGIESDADENYLAEIMQEEQAALLDMLAKTGQFAAAEIAKAA